jgi:hypothetical protein
MVSLDHERAAPEIRSPLADRVDQVDELVLIGRKLRVACGNGPAEEGDRPRALMQIGAESRA